MANSFIDTLQNGIASFFKAKDNSLVVTGIDIGTSSIKLVEMTTRNGRIILNTYGSIAIGPYADQSVGSTPSASPEIITKALNELFKECNATKMNVAVSLPAASSFFRDIAIPANIVESEIKTVVLTEARHVIPVPIADVNIDWLSIPSEIIPKEVIDINKKHFLLIAVSNESQKRAESYMKGAEIVPSLYELEVFSSMRSIYTHERAPIALIDLGASHIKVSIIHEGVMRRVVTLDRGFNALEMALVVSGVSFEAAHKLKHSSSINGLSDEEKIFRNSYNLLLKDVQTIINEYEHYSHSSVARIVLFGGGAEMNDIVSFTESVIGVPTEKSSPFARTIVPDLVKDIIGTIEPEFTIAAGVALRLLSNS